MSTANESFCKIAVFFCKDFPEVVRKALRQEPHHAKVEIRVLDGILVSSGNDGFTPWSEESAGIIDSLVAQGYTVTAYMRLSDAEAFVPVVDEIEYAVATAVNKVILERLCLELSPLKPT